MIATYRYRAARADGTIALGTIRCDGASSALAQLNVLGLFPVNVEVVPEAQGRRARISNADLAIGLRMLATLLESGLPVARALAALEEVAPGSWARAIAAAREGVRKGDSFARALENSGVEIPPVVIGVIQAGESGSGLAASVARAAELAETSARMRAALYGALAYPAVLAVVGGTSIAVVLGVILPRFATIIGDIGAETPPLARFALRLSSIAQASWWPVFAAVTIAIVGMRIWLADAAARRRWHTLLLRIPLIGDVRHLAASSGGCAALGALLTSRVPVAAALGFAGRATGDLAIQERFLLARARVSRGERLSVALGEERAITATARRLLRAGEESGQLGQMLARASDLDAERLGARMRTMVRFIEPVLIVTFAGMIAFVAAALLQAVYAVRPA